MEEPVSDWLLCFFLALRFAAAPAAAASHIPRAAGCTVVRSYVVQRTTYSSTYCVVVATVTVGRRSYCTSTSALRLPPAVVRTSQPLPCCSKEEASSQVLLYVLLLSSINAFKFLVAGCARELAA